MTNVEYHKYICETLNNIYAKKNTDYGDSFHKSIEKFGLIAAIVRMNDKFERITNLCLKQAENPLISDESIYDTLLDLANYSIMTAMELNKED